MDNSPAGSQRGPVEIVVLTLLGAITFIGGMGALMPLAFRGESGTADMSLLPICAALPLSSLTAMGMIWLRTKRRVASAWLGVGIFLWIIGLQILGWGGFAAATPGDTPFMENLGFSIALCFAPGGLLALLGLACYGYDHWLGRRLASPTAAPQENEILQRAAEYRTHITRLLRQKQGSTFASHLAPLTDTLDEWEAHLRRLVYRLERFEADSIMERHLEEVPQAIERLQAEMEAETNPQILAQMEETLAQHQAHQRHLDALTTLMRRTEFEIEETLAEMGSIYSQLQIMDAREIDRDRVRRLSADVEEQAHRLNDLLEAMDEVYDRSQI